MPGLAGIELPRVQIDHRGLALAAVQMPKSPSRDRIREEAEVAAACHREPPAEPSVMVESGNSAISRPGPAARRWGKRGASGIP